MSKYKHLLSAIYRILLKLKLRIKYLRAPKDNDRKLTRIPWKGKNVRGKKPKLRPIEYTKFLNVQ